jgi:WD40 repeat protein
VLQRSFAQERLTAVAASGDGAYLAAGGASGVLYIWELGSGRLLRTWPAHYKVKPRSAQLRCGQLTESQPSALGGPASCSSGRNPLLACALVGAWQAPAACPQAPAACPQAPSSRLWHHVPHLPHPRRCLLARWLQAVSCLRFLEGSGVLVSGGEDTLVAAWLLGDILDVGVAWDPHARVNPMHSW